MQFLQYFLLIGGILAQIVMGQIQSEQANASLPAEEQVVEEPIKATITVEATGYSSTVDQTDDTPFETASGRTVKDGVIACNFLPFGAKVKFPEIYGDKVFTVEDRMAKRYTDRVDIWFETRSEALNFGIKTLEMEFVEEEIQDA